MGTNTSNMGTLIWGSSSRGRRRVATAPMATAPNATSTVSLERTKAEARRPAGPRGAGAFIGFPPSCG